MQRFVCTTTATWWTNSRTVWNPIDQTSWGGGVGARAIASGADIWRAGAHLVPVSHMVMKILLECNLAVLKHQYAEYLALINEELMEREAFRSTAIHNIAAEEEVGIVSAAQKGLQGQL